MKSRSLLVVLSGILGCTSWQGIVRDYDYIPLSAPTTSLDLGTIAVIWDDHPSIRMDIVCTAREWAEDEFTPITGAGPSMSVASAFKTALEAQLQQNQTGASVTFGAQRSTSLSIKRLRYATVSQASVTSARVRSEDCIREIRRHQRAGRKVSAIVGHFVADVEFQTSGSLGVSGSVGVGGATSGDRTSGNTPEPSATDSDQVSESEAPCPQSESMDAGEVDVQYGIGLSVGFQRNSNVASAATIWGIKYFNLENIDESGAISTFAAGPM